MIFRLWFVTAAASAGFATANYAIIHSPPAYDPIMPLARPADPGEVSVAIETGSLLPPPQLAHSLERPIFLQSRHSWVALPSIDIEPPPPEPLPIEQILPEPVQTEQRLTLEVSLVGVRKDSQGTKALVARAGIPESRWVRSGEAMDGWTVTQIDADSITFVAGNQSKILELYPAAKPPQ